MHWTAVPASAPALHVLASPQIIELVIVRDKATQESKGSAFVWYATRSMAERAILQFHLRHVLPGAFGKQDRPLVVRKAKARVKQGLAAVMQHHPNVSMLAAACAGGSTTHMLNYSVLQHLQV